MNLLLVISKKQCYNSKRLRDKKYKNKGKGYEVLQFLHKDWRMRMVRTIKNFLNEHKHIWISAYWLIYLVWFMLLEMRQDVVMQPIHIWLDDYIPFHEWFIIPYLLWFAYMGVTIGYFLLYSKKDYYRECAFLYIGMSICLIIYMIWPNCQNLRVTEFPRENILSWAVGVIYGMDTSTNVCPSIHVYNSIGVHIAVAHSEKLKQYKWIQAGSFVLMVLICLSTVFLKQHSVFDGICAMGLALIMYIFVYRVDYSQVIQWMKNKKRKKFGDKACA